jgi:hypothetical protein
VVRRVEIRGPHEWVVVRGVEIPRISGPGKATASTYTVRQAWIGSCTPQQARNRLSSRAQPRDLQLSPQAFELSKTLLSCESAVTRQQRGSRRRLHLLAVSNPMQTRRIETRTGTGFPFRLAGENLERCSESTTGFSRADASHFVVSTSAGLPVSSIVSATVQPTLSLSENAACPNPALANSSNFGKLFGESKAREQNSLCVRFG